MSSSIVMGLDLSLTGAAACILPCSWMPADWASLKTVLVGRKLGVDATTRDKVLRIQEICSTMLELAETSGVTHAFVEGYSFGAKGASHYQLAELGGAMRVKFAERLGIYLEAIAVSSARKYLLTKLPRAKKGEAKISEKIVVQAVLIKAGLQLNSADEYDAFVVANAGLAAIGGLGVSVNLADMHFDPTALQPVRVKRGHGRCARS